MLGNAMTIPDYAAVAGLIILMLCVVAGNNAFSAYEI
jgi:hypothetical protein